jgi:hypothetical protein
MLRLSRLLLSAALLAGCSNLPGRIGPEQLAQVKRIAVVALTGQELELITGAPDECVPIASWKMTDVFFDAVRSALAADDRFVVSRLDAQKPDFRKMYSDYFGFYWSINLDRVHEQISALATHCECDTLLLVTDAVRSLESSKGPDGRGLGWLARPRHASFVYGVYSLILVDAKTLKLVASSTVFERGPMHRPVIFSRPVPSETVDPSLLPKPESGINYKQRAVIQPMLERRVRDSMPIALEELGVLGGR